MIKAESDYYPWGGELQFVNNDSNDYKFTGKKRDTETGLDYFGARYYSNGLGRWVSADWSATPVPVPYADFGDPQTLNLYGFVGGNPASKADPDGHALPLAVPPVVVAAAIVATGVAIIAIQNPQFQKAAAGALQSMTSSLGKTLTGILPGSHNPPSQPTVPPPSVPNTNTNTQTPASNATTGVQTGAPASTSQAGQVQTGPAQVKNTPRSDLPRDKAGNYLPHPEAQGPHTVVGTRTGTDGVPYTQGATFDEKGNFTGRTDVTNHGRADHTKPHFHPAKSPNSVQPGPGEPIQK